MKFRVPFIFLVGICWGVLAGGSHVYAFIGDYKSLTGNDTAVIGGFKSTEISYDIEGSSDEADIERKVLSVGVSKTINSNLKAYGVFNYVMDGDVDDAPQESDGGYSLAGGAGYTFLKRNNISVSGFGQLDYILKDDWDGNGGASFSIDGYELSGGVMGKYHFNPNLSAFATAVVVPFSDMTADIDNVGDRDIERDDMLGLQTGVIYDQDTWFVKGELHIMMESGIGISGGYKF